MSIKHYQASVVLVGKKIHVTIPELDHMELITSDEKTMKEHAEDWLMEMEDLEPNTFVIDFNFVTSESMESIEENVYRRR